MLDNVRAYTAGCFQQCFLSFRFALPSLLQEGTGGAPDQSLHGRDNAGNRAVGVVKVRGGEGVETKDDPEGVSIVVSGERHKGRSLQTRRYDFSFNNHDGRILASQTRQSHVSDKYLPFEINNRGSLYISLSLL